MYFTHGHYIFPLFIFEEQQKYEKENLTSFYILTFMV